MQSNTAAMLSPMHLLERLHEASQKADDESEDAIRHAAPI